MFSAFDAEGKISRATFVCKTTAILLPLTYSLSFHVSSPVSKADRQQGRKKMTCCESRGGVNVRLCKNTLGCQHSDTLDWLITEPSFTQVRANTRSLRADCISPLWEEMTWKSGCWVVRCLARLIYMQRRANVHVHICERFSDTGPYRHYKPSKCISMMSNDSLKTSVCLTLTDTLRARASESLTSNAWHGKMFIFKSSAERDCLLF